MAILNVPIQVRVDNEQNWDNSTLILKDGEPALCKKEDGTQELKFGDGQKTYKELSPFGGNQVEENSGDLLVTLTSIENNQASATYEQIKATINNKHLVAVIYEEEVYMLDKVQSNGTIEFRLDNSQGQKYLGISSSGVWYENSSSWQAVNINIDEVEGLEATNVQDALAELKEDGVQLNDNAVNATEAWSSKKIVDTLCSPFSVSGNPVTCHPVEGYPLSAVVSLEPKQAGSGDPSPDNVRAISGYDEVTVNVRGKNLFDANSGFALSGDASTNGFAFDGEFFKEGVTYSFSAKNATDTVNVKVSYASYGENNLVTTIPVGGSQQVAFHRNLNAINPALYIFLQTGGTIYGNGTEVLSIDEAKALNLQIEASSAPTPYEPYQPGTTAQLSLPETIYGGTVDAVTGVGSKEWEAITLSSEFLTTNRWAYATNGAQTSPTIFGEIPMANNSVGDIYCTHFKRGNAVPIKNLEYWNGSEYFGDRRIAIRNDEWTSLDDAKTWLDAQASAGTPVQVVYKLATPEPFQATGNQPIPALAGLNTVYTDGDSLAVSGRSDPTAYIQQQISDAITAAVAITGGT